VGVYYINPIKLRRQKMKTRKKIRLILALATASLLLISFSVSAVGKDELKIATWEDINTMDPGWLTSVERCAKGLCFKRATVR
jgi:hypothetical protein